MLNKITNSDHFFCIKRFVKLIGIAIMALGLSLPTIPAFAQKFSHLRISSSEIGATQYVQIGHNKSMIIDLPREVAEVIVSQPNVAGVVMRSK